MKTKEVLEKLEDLKKVAPNSQSITALQIAINTVGDYNSFFSWLMNLDIDEFGDRKELLNEIQLKLLLGEREE